MAIDMQIFKMESTQLIEDFIDSKKAVILQNSLSAIDYFRETRGYPSRVANRPRVSQLCKWAMALSEGGTSDRSRDGNYE